MHLIISIALGIALFWAAGWVFFALIWAAIATLDLTLQSLSGPGKSTPGPTEQLDNRP